MALSITENEIQMIKDLSTLLKENGEKILQGRSKLSLTTRCLQILNGGFSNFTDNDFNTSFEVVPANSPRFPIYDDLQFLFDIVQKTVSLKIIHGSATLQGNISVSSFRVLKTLELKKTPLHLLQGLQNLRGKLQTVICTRCLNKLADLLELCGGDMTNGLSWPQLLAVDFSYNSITQLDDSLRLVPSLEFIDLSHNMLQVTDKALEYLDEIRYVDISYNSLQVFPTFATSAKSSNLHTLVLRNNSLEDLHGLHELVYLRELDLGNNCLLEHTTLYGVQMLPRLQLLRLDGNPLSFHYRHRYLTIQYLHQQTCGKINLDGKVVKSKEFQAVTRHSTSSYQPRASTSQQYSESRRPTLTTNGSTTSLEDSVSIAGGDEMDGGTPTVRRKSLKKKSRRSIVKEPVIEPLSNNGAYDPSPEASRVATPSTSFKKTMDDIEAIRNQLGPSWLHTIPSNMAPTVIVTAEDEPSKDEILTSEADRKKDEGIDQLNSSGDQQPDTMTTVAEDVVDCTNASDAHAQPSIGPAKENVYDNKKQEKCSVQDENSVDKSKLHVPESEENTSSEEYISIWSDAKSDSTVDYGDEIEPLILTRIDTGEQLFVSAAERYLLEKDVNGVIVEALGLDSLRCMRRIGGKALNDDSAEDDRQKEECEELHLYFDYNRKDRKERKYRVNYGEDIQTLISVLEPILASKLEESQNTAIIVMECLKCNIKFNKAEGGLLVRRVPSVSSFNGYASGTSVDKLERLEEAISCPQCKSDRMLIEHDSDESNGVKGSNSTTPTGSIGKRNSSSNLLQNQKTSKTSSPEGSLPNAFIPMATSSAKPSPWKDVEPASSTPELIDRAFAVGPF